MWLRCRYETLYFYTHESKLLPRNLLLEFYKRPRGSYVASTLLEVVQIRSRAGNTLSLFRYFVMGSTLKDSSPWITSVAITWIFLIIFSSYGIHNTMRTLTKFQVISCTSWICLCTLVSLEPKADVFNQFLSEREMSNFLNVEVRWRGTTFSLDLLNFVQFWENCISYSTQISILCNDLWMGTLLPSNFHVRDAVVITTVIKIVTLFVVASQSSYITRVILAQYGVPDKDCLTLSGKSMFCTRNLNWKLKPFPIVGMDVIFAFIPYTLYKMQLGMILVTLWYVSIFGLLFLEALYTIICIVDSISQKYIYLKRYRSFIILAAGVIGFSIDLLQIGVKSFDTVEALKFYGDSFLHTTVLFLVSFALLFLYSSNRITDDYIFTYGYQPNSFWRFLWDTLPILVMVLHSYYAVI